MKKNTSFLLCLTIQMANTQQEGGLLHIKDTGMLQPEVSICDVLQKIWTKNEKIRYLKYLPHNKDSPNR